MEVRELSIRYLKDITGLCARGEALWPRLDQETREHLAAAIATAVWRAADRIHGAGVRDQQVKHAYQILDNVAGEVAAAESS